MKRTLIALIFMSLLAVIAISSCNTSQTETVQGEWITGTDQEKLFTIEEHLGGFGRTMMEVGYRYTEVYWAGQDENWLYAAYQLEEMEEALEHGYERRPERVKSAETFMESTLPRMMEAALDKNSDRFHEMFQNFTVQCNMCHALEEVAFITVKEPLVRASSIRF